MANVYVNRTLNLRKIQYVGFDMDHTLVRYDSDAFERMTYEVVLKKLVSEFDYPQAILKLPFDYQAAIRGLVLDKKQGNLLKLSRHAAIRVSQHGLHQIAYQEQKKIYRSKYIDLGDEDFTSVDTSFSISAAVLFAQLVEYKDKYGLSQDYETISNQMLSMVDVAHRDGTLKTNVRNDLAKYILRSENLVRQLERYRKHDKKIFVITNSDFHYTKLLLDYAINPFLKDYKDWSELFEITITHAQKPRFFYDNAPFLKINPQDATMMNYEGKLGPGIYQGGSASQFTKDLHVDGEDILYIGDHIYGDIVRLKKDCNWRTALVLEEIEQEVKTMQKVQPLVDQIEVLMAEKVPLEEELLAMQTKRVEEPRSYGAAQEAIGHSHKQKLASLDAKIAILIQEQQQAFNARWGELMRAGNEDSFFAYQVDRYACIYMAKLEDFLEHSPRTYFRAHRRPLAHELALYGASDLDT